MAKKKSPSSTNPKQPAPATPEAAAPPSPSGSSGTGSLPPLAPLKTDVDGFDAMTREMAQPKFDILTREMPMLPERSGAKLGALGLLAVGTGLGAYLSYTHLRLLYDKTYDSVCDISATLNCDVVNTSDYSELFGLPIALYAVPTYAVLAFLIFRSMGRRGEHETTPLAFSFGISFLTVLVSIFLAGVSALVLKTGCPFCMGMYAVNIGTFGLSWYASRASFGANVQAIFKGLGSQIAVVTQAAGVLLLTFGLSVGVEAATKNHLLETYGTSGPVGTAPGGTDTGGSGTGGAPVASAGGVQLDANDATYGPADAKVTLVEFADFQCGYCKRMSYTVKALKEQYSDRVRFVFKHFPMNPECNSAVKNKKHADACTAAFAGQCANTFGKFWEFHDLTFKNQMNLEEKDLLTYAREVGLDATQMQTCLKDPATRAAIAGDVEAAKPLGISGTPRIYINGKEFRGIVPKEVLEREILSALGDAATAVSAPEAPVAAGDPSTAPAQVEIALGGRSFWIDAFEASKGAKGEAISAFDQAPLNKTSWYDAKQACEAAGKRLCTAEEWIAACQGKPPVDDDKNGRFGDDLIEGTEFAYSDFYEPGACNDSQDDKVGKLAFTGSFTRCKTPTGVYDMNGNVHEWVGATEDEALLIGGQYYAKEKASCFRVNDTFGPGYANKATGFRCCQTK